MLISFKEELKIKIIILLLFLAGLSFISLEGINNKEFIGSFPFRQLIFFVISFFILFFLQKFNFNFFSEKFLYFFSFLSVFLMIVAIFFGYKKSWINFKTFSLQPIEFLKIAYILVLAEFLSKIKKIVSLRVLLKTLGVLLGASFLVFLQGDFGGLLVFILIWLGLVFFYLNRNLKVFILLSLILFSFISWNYLLKDYQKERILNFLFPERDIFGSGYNAFQSRTAFGSGGVFGKGFKLGYQAYYGFLPNAHTDFLLSSFVEQFGFLGFSIFLILNILLWNYLNKIKEFLKEPREIIFVNGFKLWFLIQFVINTFMNLGFFPIIGLPLPFFSYGGSHIIAEFFSIAIIFNFLKRVV